MMIRFTNKAAAKEALRNNRDRRFKRMWVEEYAGQYTDGFVVKAETTFCTYILGEKGFEQA